MVEHISPTCRRRSTFSPFQEAAVVSVDGFGDFGTAALGSGRGRRGSPSTGGSTFPIRSASSTGDYAISGILELRRRIQGHGSAPYGNPTFVSKLCEVVSQARSGYLFLELRFFRHLTSSSRTNGRVDRRPSARLFSRPLRTCLGRPRVPDEPLEQRHKDLARSAQTHLRRSLVPPLGAANLHGHPVKDIVLSAGAQRIRSRTARSAAGRPSGVYVHSAPGDPGGAIGAAFAVWHQAIAARAPSSWITLIGGRIRRFGGCPPREHRISTSNRPGLRYHRGDSATRAICARDRAAVVEGKVVGWFQGANGMGTTGSWQPLDPLRSATGRHEGHPQPEDQTT